MSSYEGNIDLSHNLASLKEALPEEIRIHDIDPRISEGWIPVHIIQDFACSVIFPNIQNRDDFDVEFITENGKWAISSEYFCLSEFYTDYKDAKEILNAILNNKTSIVKKV
ncbi:hypothetical protein [Abyssogena phaseoliformis symbiont]|uniref:hypothetical protein n=1 Tax=Abyssogena phaseoliformis symbiont TaxID=596095 RepID=UPI001915EFD2|nr:hypothetical protein [Abyssogena phaseoliformis symbiont]